MADDLFDDGQTKTGGVNASARRRLPPLAERMRPRKLSEYIGQTHILAPGKLLRRAIEADRVSSLILYGPPGTGKTTLAQVIAEHSRATFVAINAVLSGVKVIREEVSAAQDRARRFDQSTLLFIDEIHRFNQSQQDALLPWVEKGVITLIGATTENPYFEVNNALNSRSHIFQLRPLSSDELKMTAHRALSDPRGYADRQITLDEEALDHWVSVVDGDARSLLNALELAVETTETSQGVIHIDLLVAEDSIQERAVLYDRDGDAHFDTMSAFIKSMRGSDADASLYWLAKMINAGEPARHIFRRLLIFASEDVGLAWSQGLGVVESCAAAFDRVGMPEGRFHLSQATLAMATAPKSNATMGVFDAIEAVRVEARGEVPPHLKDSHRDGEAFGHGQGYLYPHAYQNHWVAQDYLPDSLRGKLFYTPSDQGDEALISVRVRGWREAQLEGVISGGAGDPLLSDHAERLSVTPHEERVNQWVERAMGDVSTELAMVRERVLGRALLQRDDLVLDLNAGGGLLTWPALRSAIEGGVWSYCLSREEANSMSSIASRLPWTHQPVVLYGDLAGDLSALSESSELRGVSLTQIIGRGLFADRDHWDDRMNLLQRLFSPHRRGRVTTAEPYLFGAQRLSELTGIDRDGLVIEHNLADEKSHMTALNREWRSAENEVYKGLDQWEMSELADRLQQFNQEGKSLTVSTLEEHLCSRRVRLSSQRIERWLSSTEGSYLSSLREVGISDELDAYIQRSLHNIAGRSVAWRVSWLILCIDIE